MTRSRTAGMRRVLSPAQYEGSGFCSAAARVELERLQGHRLESYVFRLKKALEDGSFERARRIVAEAESECRRPGAGEGDRDPATVPIAECGLPVHVRETLERAGVIYVGQIGNYTRGFFEELPMFGAGCMQRLDSLVRRFGISYLCED